VDAHYFGGCPLIHKYWSKTKKFIYNQVLKNNDFLKSIFMHIVVLSQIWKKIINKLSFNLISFKMQKFITNFHCYNYFQSKMVLYFQLISCLELFASIPNAYSRWSLIFLPLITHSFMRLTSLCLLHIVTSMSVLSLCFIRSLWGN
jgi:hypothetical protein